VVNAAGEDEVWEDERFWCIDVVRGVGGRVLLGIRLAVGGELVVFGEEVGIAFAVLAFLGRRGGCGV